MMKDVVQNKYKKSIKQSSALLYFTAIKLNTIVLSFCALAHGFYFIIFSVFEIRPAVIFNGFSVILYIFLIIFLYKKKYAFTLYAVYLEICLNATFMTLLLGWDFGFYLLLLTGISLPFFYPFKKGLSPFIFCGITAAVFMGLRIYTFNHAAFRKMESLQVSRMMYIFNCIISIIPVILYSGLYNNTMHKSQRRLHEKNRTLMQLASVDPLTGLLNRRSMVTRLDQAMYRCDSCGKKFALAICDIDDFKNVNDSYGHDCGDYVLKTLASILQNQLSKEDAVCRWGGEELLILFADNRYADQICENLRQAVQAYPFGYNNAYMQITLTIGLCAGESNISVNEMLIQADRNLYIGKKGGKNCVVS